MLRFRNRYQLSKYRKKPYESTEYYHPACEGRIHAAAMKLTKRGLIRWVASLYDKIARLNETLCLHIELNTELIEERKGMKLHNELSDAICAAQASELRANEALNSFVDAVACDPGSLGSMPPEIRSAVVGNCEAMGATIQKIQQEWRDVRANVEKLRGRRCQK